MLAGVPVGLLVDGRWTEAEGVRTFSVEDPSTGEVIAEVADGTGRDMVRALDAAAGAQDAWAQTAPRARSEVLRQAFETMSARLADLALLMTLEMGKPLDQSRSEVVYASEFFRWFSEEAVRIDGRWTVSPEGGTRLVVMHQPVGPSLLVTPWNFPAAMVARKVAPALAAGCTVVVKPAEETPLSALALAQILSDSGLPPGVLNVVTTSDPDGATAHLFGDRRLRKVSFTGSTDVGRILLGRAAAGVLRTSMELGGNAPFIVFDDADLDDALDGAVAAKMRNMGEACTAANRFFVHESLAGEFGSRLAARMSTLRVGRGTEEGVEVGPLISAEARRKVDSLVRGSRESGSRILAGGAVPDGPGYFYPPTVISGVRPGAALIDGEIFGPVAPIVPFSTEQEVVHAANATTYGLSSYVFTSNLDRAVRVAESLEFGMVGINTGMVSNPAAPFGGVKSSGLGREGGREGIHEYLQAKYVALSVS